MNGVLQKCLESLPWGEEFDTKLMVLRRGSCVVLGLVTWRERTCWIPRMHCGVWQSPKGEAAGQTEALVPPDTPPQMLPGN